MEQMLVNRRTFLKAALASVSSFALQAYAKRLEMRGVGMPGQIYQPQMPTMAARAQEHKSIPVDALENEGVKHALEVAGPNRKELEKAIAHFVQKKDALGLQAVCHLIAESAYRFGWEIVGNNLEWRHHTPQPIPEPMLDAEHLTADFLIKQVENATAAYRPGRYAWTADVPQELFVQRVVSYRCEIEPLSKYPVNEYISDPKKFDELGLGISYQKFHRDVDDFSKRYAQERTDEGKMGVMKELIFYINTTVLIQTSGRHEYTDRLNTWDIIDANRSAVGMIQAKRGEATDLSQATVLVLRALGLPAVLDRVPLWAGYIETDTWLSLQMPYKTFAVYGGYPCDDDKMPDDYFEARGIGKNEAGKAIMLRENGGAPGEYNHLLRDALDRSRGGRGWNELWENFSDVEIRYLMGLNGISVASDYYQPFKLQMQGFEPGKLYHLCLYNREKFRSVLPAYADKNGRLTFDQIEQTQILYAVGQQKGQNMQLKTLPFRVGEDGNPQYFSIQDSPAKEVDCAAEGLFSFVKPNAPYVMMVFDGRDWNPCERLHSDEKGTMRMHLTPQRLYRITQVGEERAADRATVWSGRKSGQPYSISVFENNDWHQAVVVIADANGQLVAKGLDPSKVYTVEEDLAQVVRPFIYNEGKPNPQGR